MERRGAHWADADGERASDERRVREEARAAQGPWISSLRRWDLFATLTYDRRRPVFTAERIMGVDLPARVTCTKALRDGGRFLGLARKELGRPVSGVLAAEPHADGSYHLHGVLDVSGLQPGDVRRLTSLWFRRHGWAELEEPRSQEDVSGYCGKYLSKPSAEVFLARDLRGESGKQRGL